MISVASDISRNMTARATYSPLPSTAAAPEPPPLFACFAGSLDEPICVSDIWRNRQGLCVAFLCKYQVEECAVVEEDVCESPAVTILAFDVVFEPDSPADQAGSELRSLFAEALNGFAGVFRLRGVHPDQADSFLCGFTGPRDVDGVTVNDLDDHSLFAFAVISRSCALGR